MRLGAALVVLGSGLASCTALFPFEGQPHQDVPCLQVGTECEHLLEELEPNDDASRANPGPCVDGSLPPGDQDWFVVRVCRERTFWATLAAVENAGVVVGLFREADGLAETGRLMGCPQHPAIECVRTEDGSAYLEPVLQEGIYYLQVSSSNRAQITDYELFGGLSDE